VTPDTRRWSTIDPFFPNPRHRRGGGDPGGWLVCTMNVPSKTTAHFTYDAPLRGGADVFKGALTRHQIAMGWVGA
jgi:hypothetical protein